jgi:hypothetical protein
MGTLCHIALAHISSTPLPPVKRILLGREFGVVDWLTSGYIDLMTRKEPLSVEDFRLLGLPTALKLSQQARRPYIQLSCPQSSDNIKHSTTRAISDAFKNEISTRTAPLPIVERIILARGHGVSEWLVAAYSELVERNEDITIEEAERLGEETTVHLCRVRETAVGGSGIGFNTMPSRRVQKLFEEELRLAEANGELYKYSLKTQTAGSDTLVEGGANWSFRGSILKKRVTTSGSRLLRQNLQVLASPPGYTQARGPRLHWGRLFLLILAIIPPIYLLKTYGFYTIFVVTVVGFILIPFLLGFLFLLVAIVVLLLQAYIGVIRILYPGQGEPYTRGAKDAVHYLKQQFT